MPLPPPHYKSDEQPVDWRWFGDGERSGVYFIHNWQLPTVCGWKASYITYISWNKKIKKFGQQNGGILSCGEKKIRCIPRVHSNAWGTWKIWAVGSPYLLLPPCEIFHIQWKNEQYFFLFSFYWFITLEQWDCFVWCRCLGRYVQDSRISTFYEKYLSCIKRNELIWTLNVCNWIRKNTAMFYYKIHFMASMT